MGKPKHIPMFGKASRPSGLQAKKWHIQAKCSEDKQQMLFCSTASPDVFLKVNPSKFATITEKGIDPFLNTRCPFCLSYLRLTKFLVSHYDRKGKSKGYDRGKGKCPQCSQGMQLKTLMSMRTWLSATSPEEGVKKFAAWVWEYRRSGFFKKIKFAQFNSMLQSMGWSRDFWDEYKRLKGDLPDAKTQKNYDDLFAAQEESFN